MRSIISNLIEPVSYFIFLFIFIAYFKLFRQSKTKVLILFYLNAGLFMLYATYLGNSNKENTFVYNYLLLPLSIILLPLYFQKIINNSKKRNIIQALTYINLSVFIGRLFLSKQNIFFDSIGFALLGLTVVICCYLFFNQKINEISEQPIYEDFDFWVVCSFFISYSGSFLIFLTYYYLTNRIYLNEKMDDSILITFLWGIPNILSLASSLFTLTGFLWVRYHRKLS